MNMHLILCFQFMIIHLCNMRGWVKSALDGIEENTIWQCFIKAICLPVMSNVISNQDTDQSAPSSSQVVDGLLEILQEIQLDDSFLVSLGIDDTNIDQIAKDQIEMDALDATGNGNVDNVNIVKSVLEQHILLQSASNSDDGDVVEIPPVVTVKQANWAITDLINFLSWVIFANGTSKWPATSKELAVHWSTSRNLRKLDCWNNWQ